MVKRALLLVKEHGPMHKFELAAELKLTPKQAERFLPYFIHGYQNYIRCDSGKNLHWFGGQHDKILHR